MPPVGFELTISAGELITRPVESYRLCCVVVCDLETSRIGVPYIYDINNLRVNASLHFNAEPYTSAHTGRHSLCGYKNCPWKIAYAAHNSVLNPQQHQMQQDKVMLLTIQYIWEGLIVLHIYIYIYIYIYFFF